MFKNTLIGWVVKAVIIGLALYILYATATWFISQGEQKCHSEAMQFRLKELEESQKKVAQLQAENVANKAEYEKKLHEVDVKYEKEAKDAKTKYDSDLALIKRGGMYAPVKKGTCTRIEANSTSGGVSNSEAGSSGYITEEVAELSPEFVEKLYKEADRADADVRDFNKALDKMNEDYKQCGTVKQFEIAR